MSGPDRRLLFLEPIVIDAAAALIHYEHAGGVDSVSLDVGTYYLLGDGSAEDLVAAVCRVMNEDTGNTDTVSFSLDFALEEDGFGADDGRSARVVFTSTSSSFKLLFGNVAASTARIAPALGFEETDTDAGTTQTSTLSPSSAWVPSEAPSVDEVTDDRDGTQTQSVDLTVRSVERGGPYLGRVLRFDDIDEERVLEELSPAGRVIGGPGTFQAFRRRVRGGVGFRLYAAKENRAGALLNLAADYPDPELEALGVYKLHSRTAHGVWRPDRGEDGQGRTSFVVELLKSGAFALGSPAPPGYLTTLVVDYDADDPGAGLLPRDRGTMELGTMGPTGTGQSHGAATGLPGHSAWSFDGNGVYSDLGDATVITAGDHTYAQIFRPDAASVNDAVSAQRSGSVFDQQVDVNAGDILVRYSNVSTNEIQSAIAAPAWVIHTVDIGATGKHELAELGDLEAAVSSSISFDIDLTKEQYLGGSGATGADFEGEILRVLRWNTEIDHDLLRLWARRAFKQA